MRRGNFIFQATVLKFRDLLGGWKLAQVQNFSSNISKIMPVRQKNPQGHGVIVNAAIIDSIAVKKVYVK